MLKKLSARSARDNNFGWRRAGRYPTNFIDGLSDQSEIQKRPVDTSRKIFSL